MAKYKFTWKDPDFDTRCIIDKASEEEQDKIFELINEYITVEVDTEAMTARVVDRY